MFIMYVSHLKIGYSVSEFNNFVDKNPNAYYQYKKRLELHPKCKNIENEYITEFKGNRRLFEYSSKEFPVEIANMHKSERRVEKNIREQRMYGKKMQQKRLELTVKLKLNNY